VQRASCRPRLLVRGIWYSDREGSRWKEWLVASRIQRVVTAAGCGLAQHVQSHNVWHDEVTRTEDQIGRRRLMGQVSARGATAAPRLPLPSASCCSWLGCLSVGSRYFCYAGARLHETNDCQTAKANGGRALGGRHYGTTATRSFPRRAKPGIARAGFSRFLSLAS
jgi:hypothetical protein